MKDTSAGCGGLPQGTEAGHVRFYLKEPQPNAARTQADDPVSYLVKILTGLGKTPTDYLIIDPSNSPTIMLLGQSVLDPDDDRTWDWYEVWCPNAGDVGLPPASEAGHIKVYPKEPEPKVSQLTEDTPVSYLVKVLTGLGKTPKDYVTKNPTIVPIGQAVVDPDDGKTWDWFNVWCPTGPPCVYLQELFTEVTD
ncbi:MAG TPA: hypothetical protein VN950_26955 [Terriglobales bacterium]|nr:hypothetical protein [Terriglobales bacterium]